MKKEEFPELLSNTLDKMNEAKQEAIKRDLVSGFEATGVVPLNRNRILNKVPHDSDEGQQEQFREQYQNSLVTFLKEKRYASTPTRGQPSRLT